MTEIFIPLSNHDVLTANFRMLGTLYGVRDSWITQPVITWLQPYIKQGLTVEWTVQLGDYIGPGQVVQRLEGLKIKFSDPNIAMLFKLTFGGL